MGTYGFPDIMSFFEMLYGAEGVDLGGLTCLYFGDATGRVWSGNPPYYLTEFLQIYPTFFGPTTTVTPVNIVYGKTTISGFGDMSTLAVGQVVVNLNSIPPDAIIQQVDKTLKTITISTIPTQDDNVVTYYSTQTVLLVAM